MVKIGCFYCHGWGSVFSWGTLANCGGAKKKKPSNLGKASVIIVTYEFVSKM